VVGAKAITPAQVKVAIRKLRAALKQFVAGWVDDETAELIPADLDERLANREQALGRIRIKPSKQLVYYLCEQIGDLLTQTATKFEIVFEEHDKIRYVVAALDHAGVKHSFSEENPARFAAHVFPRTSST
jgi:hypothetical protein